MKSVSVVLSPLLIVVLITVVLYTFIIRPSNDCLFDGGEPVASMRGGVACVTPFKR